MQETTNLFDLLTNPSFCATASAMASVLPAELDAILADSEKFLAVVKVSVEVLKCRSTMLDETLRAMRLVSALAAKAISQGKKAGQRFTASLGSCWKVTAHGVALTVNGAGDQFLISSFSDRAYFYVQYASTPNHPFLLVELEEWGGRKTRAEFELELCEEALACEDRLLKILKR